MRGNEYKKEILSIRYSLFIQYNTLTWLYFFFYTEYTVTYKHTTLNRFYRWFNPIHLSTFIYELFPGYMQELLCIWLSCFKNSVLAMAMPMRHKRSTDWRRCVECGESHDLELVVCVCHVCYASVLWQCVRKRAFVGSCDHGHGCNFPMFIFYVFSQLQFEMRIFHLLNERPNESMWFILSMFSASPILLVISFASSFGVHVLLFST